MIISYELGSYFGSKDECDSDGGAALGTNKS